MASAAPGLGPAYGDNMVLQKDQPVTLEGHAQAGEMVRVKLGDATSSVRADKSGSFAVTLPPQPKSAAGVALELTDSTGTTRFANILFGNVFLCSGQSNMELSVNRALDTWNQLRLAADDGIRLLMVPRATAPVPQADFAGPVAWKAATSETVAEFSAACFYMGKELRRLDPDTPVGLIHSNWGGSAARAWMTQESVRALYGEDALAQLQTYARDPFEATQAFVPHWFDWWRRQDDGGEPWQDSGALDWKPIPKFSFWNEWEGTGLDREPRANVWLRQTLTLTAEQASQQGEVSIGAIDDLDLTFVNGRPIGYTFGWGVERTYRVPAGYLREGANEILIAANNMWDTGGFFGSSDRLFFQPGDGSAPVPLGADWEYSVAQTQDVPPRAPWDANAGLGVMHNAMIAPLGRMRLAGVAWYQGESDVGQPDYDSRLRELFAGWRGQFGDQTKMLVVQLADYGARVTRPVASGWAQLRQEQLEAVEADSNAVLVTAIDIGEATDIHPANKNDLGKRLARAFRGESMPMPVAAVQEASTVTVNFKGVEGGLVAQSGPYPIGVELCGTSQESCRYVVPRLSGESLIIDLAEGEIATRVRYAWSDAPIVNLYDGRGLPVPGFELEIAQ
ncbi:sialate O-acetylesterase [Erythrobacter sp. SDW2]|uniref:sialate O-acetylesterase n=1 Tax=Erythrobacter sp. SDW2 TaxID=2907154 RepID=UPI001F390043|nr:sialate O-acetylesterase [Erythrobacter sp. SDW2]UIP06065.1 sialate O-acetylesterase [Erythrobacter sp. SDW2]